MGFLSLNDFFINPVLVLSLLSWELFFVEVDVGGELMS